MKIIILIFTFVLTQSIFAAPSLTQHFGGNLLCKKATMMGKTGNVKSHVKFEKDRVIMQTGKASPTIYYKIGAILYENYNGTSRTMIEYSSKKKSVKMWQGINVVELSNCSSTKIHFK